MRLLLTLFSQIYEDTNGGRAKCRILMFEQFDDCRNGRLQWLTKLAFTSTSVKSMEYGHYARYRASSPRRGMAEGKNPPSLYSSRSMSGCMESRSTSVISSSRSNQRYLNDMWLPLTVFSQRYENTNSRRANSRIFVFK